MQTKLSVLFVFVLLSLVFSTAILATDRELKQCKDQCRVQQQFDEEHKKECIQQCKRFYQEKQRREREQEGGGGSRDDEPEERSPYVFEDRHFSTIIKSEHGQVRVLPRFTERSSLLKGIDNYRLFVLEAEPQTFVLPKHCDGDLVFIVAQGKGSISMVRQNKRESFNIKEGDIVVVPAGTTEYVINRSNGQKLIVASLIRPVNTPGQFQSYFGAGGEEPESFFNAFSDDILEAAFNVKKDKFQKIFGQQSQGAIVKASEKQIREMSRHEEGGIWPFGGEQKSTINIFQQGPLKSNQYGQLFVVTGSDFHQLQDLDVGVCFANITRGGMTTLMYNSRATKIAIVSNGEGYFEMACPHLSGSQQGRQGQRGGSESAERESQSQQGRQGQRGGSERESQSQQGQQGSQKGRSSEKGERKGTPSYQKVSARLRRGVAVVIPAGHPFAIVASDNKNLEMFLFEVNSNNNEKVALAGKSNVMSQLEKDAKELAFGAPASEVDEVFKSQEGEFFFKGPSQRQQQRGQHEGRADE